MALDLKNVLFGPKTDPSHRCEHGAALEDVCLLCPPVEWATRVATIAHETDPDLTVEQIAEAALRLRPHLARGESIESQVSRILELDPSPAWRMSILKDLLAGYDALIDGVGAPASDFRWRFLDAWKSRITRVPKLTAPMFLVVAIADAYGLRTKEVLIVPHEQARAAARLVVELTRENNWQLLRIEDYGADVERLKKAVAP